MTRPLLRTFGDLPGGGGSGGSRRAAPGAGSVMTLSWAGFTFAVAISVAAFGLLVGADWDTPGFDFTAAVLWSYLPIPPTVLALLAARQRLTGWALIFDSALVAGAKLTITAIALSALKAHAGPPPEPVQAVLPGAAAWTAPTPTVIPPGTTGVLDGVVRDRAGAPVADALVWISRGLEPWVFAVPEAPVVLINDGQGLQPAVATAQAGQLLSLRSGDGRLHTASGSSGRKPRFNLAVPSDVRGNERRLVRGAGLVEVGCTVHPEERLAHVLVVEHPFTMFTDGEGRFRFARVPAAGLEVSAWQSARGQATVAVTVESGDVASTTLELRPPPRYEARRVATPRWGTRANTTAMRRH